MSGANRHDLRRRLRDILPLALTGLCIFLFLIPFGTAGIPGDSIFDISVTHEQMKYRLIGDGFLPAVQLCAVLFGFLAGLFTFRFLLDAGQSSAVFSLPMSRKSLYSGRVITGIISLAGAILIPIVLSFALNLAALGLHSKLIPASLYLFLGIFVTATAAFIIASIGTILAGNTGEAVFFSAALLASPYALTYCADSFLKHLLWGNPFGAQPYLGGAPILPRLTEILAPFNPALFFYNDMSLHRMFYRPHNTDIPPAIYPGATWVWLGLCLALGVIGYVIFTGRRAEQAGFSGKNSLMTRICTFVPTIIVCCLVFDLAAKASLIFGIALLIFAFVVCTIICERTIAGVKEKKSPLKKHFLSAYAGAAVLLILALDAGVGYGMYFSLPAVEKTASVSVSYAGDPNFLGITALGSSTSVSYYTAARYTYTEPKDITRALGLHETIDSGGRRPLARGEDDFAETVVPYDVVFEYTGKDGKVKSWYYDRASLAELEALLGLEETAGALLGVQYALGGEGAAEGTVYSREAYLRGDIYLADMTYRDIYTLNLSAEWRGELLARMREDATGQDIKGRYFPAGEPLAVMMFTFNGGNDIKTFSYHLNNAFVYLHEDCWPQTIAFLRSNNLWFDETQTDLGASTNPDAVETLILQEYDPYIGMNMPSFPQTLYFMSYLSSGSNDFRIMKDFGRTNVVSDPEKIADILPRLRSNYFLSEPGSLAAVKYKGSDVWVYKFVPDP